MRVLDPAYPIGPELTSAVGEIIDRFLAAQAPLLEEIGSMPLLDVARGATAGGKRIRPAFCYWGYVAAAGFPPEPGPLLTVASSLDLLHVSALVHDDLIDDADTRRGLPAAHRRFEAIHSGHGRGDGVTFGRSAATLLGDLLLMWSIELAESSGIERLDQAQPLLAMMRAEVTAGQYLDVAAQHGLTGALSYADELTTARRVLEFKSARYTVSRPAQIGAALGGADARLHEALAEFGSQLGHAFQLRDDLLGVYGDPILTGKPHGGDLREGKRTVLVLTALSDSPAADARELEDMLGRQLSEEDVTRAAGIIEACGAKAKVETMIQDHAEQALAVLSRASITDEGRAALTELTSRSVQRAH